MHKNSYFTFSFLSIPLLFCYYLYVNPEYKLYICEIEYQAEKVEINEYLGDGYKEPIKIKYDSLVDEFNRQLFDSRQEF